MGKKRPASTRKPKMLKPINLDLSGNSWDEHSAAIRDSIKQLDRRAAQSLADSRSIVVSNDRKKI